MAAGPRDARAPREVEIKLEFDPADRVEIEAHPLLAAARPEKETLISVYFDTPDHALRKGQMVLRVRKAGRRYLQAIKGMDGAAQLFDRPEWEHEVSGLEPDFRLVAGTPAGPILEHLDAAALRPLFRTRVERMLYRLFGNETEIEIAIDQGEIEAETQWSPVHELELELKQGTPAELFRLARRLSADVPLRLAVKTKAERGYELADGVAAGAEKAKLVVLDRSMSCAHAFRAIGESCLRQIVANEPLTARGDAEALHQMRIGLRRLRATIAVFAKMTADSEQQRIEAELKWITNELGPARDLDVFAADVLQPLAKDGDHAEAHRTFAAARAKAYAAAAGSIRSDRFRKALLEIAEWIEVGPWTADDSLAKRRESKVKAHAAKRLARMRSDVRDKGEDLRELSPKKRHKLRIKAKVLRYAIEFFAGLFPDEENTKRREAALSALKDMQDELGALNDLAQREGLAATALAVDGHGPGPATAKLLAADKHEIARRLKRAEAAHGSFAKVKSFWN